MTGNSDTDSSSIECRANGNKFYRKRNFFLALKCYNESLSSAESESVEASFAYANRSAVYFEVKEYQLCLDNIQLARESGYPVEKLQTLKDREGKCKSLMENDVKSDDDPWNFFKLSYPANEKIPFIAECLQEDKKFGRQIITNRDLQPGDIIAIEEPIFKYLEMSLASIRCSNCLKSNKMSLIPNDNFPNAMFCSKECVNESSAHPNVEESFNDDNFGVQMLSETIGICGEEDISKDNDKLQQLVVDPELSNKTIFDFDFSNPDDPLYKYHMLIAVNSLKMLESLPSELIEVCKGSEFKLRMLKILGLNSPEFSWPVPNVAHQIDDENVKELRIGRGLSAFGSLLNHSCIPNVHRVSVDNKFVFIVQLQVAKGQQLTISYGPSFARTSRDKRQNLLMSRLGPDCSCEACVNDYPQLNFPWTALGDFDRSSLAALKEEYKNNCKIIVKNDKKSLEVAKLSTKNWFLLATIAKSEPFIFSS